MSSSSTKNHNSHNSHLASYDTVNVPKEDLNSTAYRQLTLDNLLESLAIENNVAEQHLAKIDIENGNSSKRFVRTSTMNTSRTSNGKRFNDFNNNKLGSETESSSSVSPSLSERSNGISWSDQVCSFIHFLYNIHPSIHLKLCIPFNLMHSHHIFAAMHLIVCMN